MGNEREIPLTDPAPRHCQRYGIMERAAREARDAAMAALDALENLFFDGMFWGTSVWSNHPRFVKARKHLLEAEYQLREALARLDDVEERCC
jgi:hypothetical protein